MFPGGKLVRDPSPVATLPNLTGCSGCKEQVTEGQSEDYFAHTVYSYGLSLALLFPFTSIEACRLHFLFDCDLQRIQRSQSSPFFNFV